MYFIAIFNYGPLFVFQKIMCYVNKVVLFFTCKLPVMGKIRAGLLSRSRNSTCTNPAIIKNSFFEASYQPQKTTNVNSTRFLLLIFSE